MSKEITLERGSGNVFQDFGLANSDLEQGKAILAARIIKILDEQGLSTRKAAALTGYQHADFSRIRKLELGRFTLDRLVKMVGALDDENEVIIDFRPRTDSQSELIRAQSI